MIPVTTSTDNGYYMCVVTEEGISGNVYWSTPVKLELQCKSVLIKSLFSIMVITAVVKTCLS